MEKKHGGILINITAEQAREVLRAIDKTIKNKPQDLTEKEEKTIQNVAQSIARQLARLSD